MPYILTLAGTGLMIDNRLESGPSFHSLDLLEAMDLVRTPRFESIEKAIFALKVPYLPDLSTSPYIHAQSDEDRLKASLQQQIRFVASFAKWKGMAFSLRYVWSPGKRETEVALLIKGIARPGYGQYLAEKMTQDIAAILASFDFPNQLIENEQQLRQLLVPVTGKAHIVEIRQHEDIARMIIGEAYVVYPFRHPQTPWLSAFRVLSEQKYPCFINVHLQPTSLYGFEQEQFSRAAQIASSYSEIDLEEHYLTRKGRVSDPVAKIVSRLYASYLSRFRDPYLVTMQVGSPDVLTAQSVAQAFADEMSERHSLEDASSGENSLPSGYDFVRPNNEHELEAALKTLTELDLNPWGYTEATVDKARLRFLVDSRAAAAAFRFPIPLRGGIPSIRTKQSVPFHHVGPPILSDHGTDAIVIGHFKDNRTPATVPLKQLTRHTLVAGFTGSGKTTTCMHILQQLWERGLPFLVIEPVKTEYRSLIKTAMGEHLKIFTLGNEGVSPFRLNPLEILPGVRVESHIAQVRACFEAALPTFGIFPSLIEESLHNIYESKEWNLTDRGKTNETRLMPTLGELYAEIIRVTETRGYSDKTLQDIRAAASGRIVSLLRGGKGRMLNTRRSIPIDLIMNSPTILELEALNDEERALVVLFLLMIIREYCRTTRLKSNLQHVTLLEEAHRIIRLTPHATNREVSSDTRAQAAEMFNIALSEVRSFGEGLFIADQVPSRLGEDALKNTNLKIVHRLLGEDDRRAVGTTMNMTQEQQNHVSLLEPGTAAIFFEGYERPSFIAVPNYRENHHLPERVLEDDVEKHMAGFQVENNNLLLPFDGCRFCKKQCRYRDRVMSAAYEVGSRSRYRQALLNFEKRATQGELELGWSEIIKESLKAVNAIGLGSDRHAAYCYFVHLWELDFVEAMATRFHSTVLLEE